MFHKVNIRLTVLLTSVCSGIMLIMSAFYIYMNYRSIFNNSFLNFKNDMNTICNDLSRQSVFSYDALMEYQYNYGYSIFLFDNDTPLKFTIETKSTEELEKINILKTKFNTGISLNLSWNSPQHFEYIYNEKNNKLFFSAITIQGQYGHTDIYIIDELKYEKKQSQELLILFIVIITFAAIILFIFSYFFTKTLLRPIKRTHEQQASFIAAASHEIRNPVNTIISALEAMEKSEGKERENFANIAKKEGKRLTFLTEDLLTLARSDNSSFMIRKTTAELDTILLDSYEAFIAPAGKKNIRINITLPEESIELVEIDTERIKQVLSILLSNAVSYTIENGIIDINYSEYHSKHVITISDNGPGISDEDKKHIFERFYRADRARESRSHFGLGLAIAKEIIDLHNGSIYVEDSKYGGASFIITLGKNS